MAFVKAGLWGPQAIIDSTGHPQPGITATVYLTDGVTLASLWTSAAKSVVMANPTQADIHGNLHFYADPGPYMLKMLIGTVVTWLDVEVPIDPGEAAQDSDVTAAIATAEAYADGIVAAALAAALAGSQPLDADLTAIAALSTTAFGRAFLALADAAAGRTALGLGTAATHAVGDFDAAGTAAAAAAALVNSAPGTLDTLNELATALADDPAFATTVTNALAGKQPLDADLTAIAALSTTAFGRSALALTDSAALRVLAGTVIGTDVQAHDADLDAIAALSTTAFGRALLVLADAAALRTAAGLGTAATAATTDFDAAGTASAAVAALINGAPGALDTLNELATALGDDAAFATTVTNALATKLIAGATSGTANQAALPAAVAHTHEVVKTDDGGVYVSTGSSWVQLVPPAGTYAPASGIAESAVTNLVADLAAKSVILTPTAVKTANYTAAAGDLVLCDTSGGIFTVTLPTAPTDKTSIAVDLITSGSTLTIAGGGADVFQKAAGPASLTMNTANRVLVFQYQSATGVWHVRDHLPAIISTKGDLLTYGTERVRLGVGTDGQVLTADSTQTPGLKWGAITGALNVIDATASPYLVVADGKVVTDAVSTASSATVTSASAAFTSADTGKAFQFTIPMRQTKDANISSGVTTITSATAAFTANDVGKTVTLQGYAAATKAYTMGQHLTTTIASFTNSTTVVLTAAPTWSGTTAALTVGQSSVVGTLTFVNATTVTMSGTAAFTSTGATLAYGTDNRAALQLAQNAAVTAKKTLVLPPGVICMKPTTGASRSVKATGDVKIQGAGQYATTMQWIGLPTDGVIQAFWEFDVTQNFTVSDMTCAGPIDPGFVLPAVFASGQAASAVYVTGTDTATSPVHRLERLKATNYFGTAFAFVAVGHNGDTYVRECDVSTLSVSMQMYSAANFAKRFWVYDCNFHDMPFLTDYASDFTGEFFYIHNNVALHCERTRFDNNGYYAVQWNGGSGSPAPQFARFHGCRWGTGINNCLYTSSVGTGATSVEQCTFNHFGNGVMVRQSTRVINNVFNLGGTVDGATGIVYTAVSSGDTFDIIGNEFNLVDTSAKTGKGMSIGQTAGSMWKVLGNSFRMTGSGTGMVGVELVTAGDAIISGNTFVGITNGAHIFGVDLFSGYAQVNDNRFFGVMATASGEGAIVVNGNSGRTMINRNEFNLSSGRPIWAASGGFYFHDNAFPVLDTVPSAAASTYAFGRLAGGLLTTAVVSGATIAPTLSGDAVHISGTTTIDTINLAGDATTNQLFSGAKLTLLFDSTAATSAAGNITPKSTAARTAGTAAIFMLDPAANKWIEL